MRWILVALLGVALAAPVHAKTLPSPFTPFTPPNAPVRPLPGPSPVPAPGSQIETQDLINALLEIQTKFVADVNNAAVRAAMPMPNVTPATAVDPYGVVCFPALASWAAGLKPLGTIPGDTSPDAGPVSVFEDARILGKIALSTSQQIQSSGLPFALNQACGGYFVDVAAEAGQIVGTIQNFDMLLARWIPKGVLEKHGVGNLAAKS